MSGKRLSAAGLASTMRPSEAHTTTPSPIARMTAFSSAARACSDWARRWRRTWTSIRSLMSRAIATMACDPSDSDTGWSATSTEIGRPVAGWTSVITVADRRRPAAI